MTPEQMDRIDRLLAEKFEFELLNVTYFDSAYESERQKELREWLNEQESCKLIGDYYINVEKNICIPYEDWSPTRNINQALGDGGAGTVVGELKKKGWVLNSLYQDLNDPTWSCSFILVVNKRPKTDEYSEANTPTLTICLAALAALGIDLEEEKDD